MQIRLKPVSGYLKNNPNNIILDFEKDLLNYCAENPEEFQCVITDSLTNALETVTYYNFLYNNIKTYTIPTQTYFTAYTTCKQYANIVLEVNEWEKYYKFGNLIDSATYLPNKELNKIFEDNPEIEFFLLSFGNGKPLSNNRGGAIIFKKDNNKYNFLKRYVHNGRDSAIKVEDDVVLKLNNELIGKRYNLVPEQVSELSKKLKTNKIKDVNGSFRNYPNIIKVLG